MFLSSNATSDHVTTCNTLIYREQFLFENGPHTLDVIPRTGTMTDGNCKRIFPETFF